MTKPDATAKLAEVVAFLNGTAPLDGVWFGGAHPTERGDFWWRKHLLVAYEQALAATPAPIGGPPHGYESTTPAYIRWVSPERYAKFSPKVQAWYRPYWLAATPAPAPQPLTVEEIMALAFKQRYVDGTQYLIEVARAIERAHGIGKEASK